MLRLNLLSKRFTYVAVEKAACGAHLNDQFEHVFNIWVRCSHGFDWVRSYKMGPVHWRKN